jgi:hypothetical protein
MEVKIRQGNEMLDATIEMVDGVMIVSPKVEKFEPKDGDVIVCDSYGCLQLFICKKYENENSCYCYCFYDGFSSDIEFDESAPYCVERYATEEEKKLLFDKMKEKGYEFDFEKKELVKLKWKPADREKVYVAGFTFYGEHPFCPFEDAAYADSMQWRAVYKRGWYFKTIEECQSFCDKLNQAIDSVKL